MAADKRTLLPMLAGIALMASAVSASASSYIALDGSSLSLDHSSEEDINPHGLRVRLGVRLAEGFDIEAHIGGGADSSTRSFEEIRATFAGLYLKGYLPIGYRSALFALLGGSAVELSQTTERGKFSDDRSGFSYGFGLETQLSERLDLSADYIGYTLEDDNFSQVSAINLGLKFYF